MVQTTSTVQRSDFNNQANLMNYAINQKMLNMNTVMVCLFQQYVMHGDTKYGEVVQLIDNVDAVGKPLKSPMQFDVPIGYIMGGDAGINVTYKANDLVLVVYSQQTLSDIKLAWNAGRNIDSTLQPSNFGKFTLEDGIIIGKISPVIPTTIIDINDLGITITSNNTPLIINTGTSDTTVNGKDVIVNATSKATITAPDAEINANNSVLVTTPTMTVNGNLVVTGTANLDSKDFLSHKHGGVTTGSNDTGGVA